MSGEPLVHRDRSWVLRRLPLKQDDRLRAWDTADAYLLRFLDGLPNEKPEDAPDLPADAGLLLVNDAFGALAVPLHQRAAASWGDSHLAELALRYNLCANELPADAVPFVPATSVPDGPFAVALIKLPRNLTFLRDQLLQLRPRLAPGARVILGGMIKHTPMTAWRLLEEVIGPAVTTPGWKKARLGCATLAARPDLPAADEESTYALPGTDLQLVNLPNLFSREKPDLGSRLLLAHLPAHEEACTAVDLGCGNGILAVALARQCPNVQVLGVDESYQAVASARRNVALLPDGPDRLRFEVDDCGAMIPDGSVDLVVCNPPFHQGHATGDMTAWTMFTAAHRILRPGGELRLVGNRHLGYHAKLRRLYGRVELVASDERFVILSAFKNTSPA